MLTVLRAGWLGGPALSRRKPYRATAGHPGGAGSETWVGDHVITGGMISRCGVDLGACVDAAACVREGVRVALLR
jgi:hypothetical protein